MRLKSAFVAGCIVWCGVLAPASGQQVLDQQFAPPMAPANLSALVNEGKKLVGQTFTAGLSGPLQRVTLDFDRAQSAETDFEFTLRATSGGLPTGSPLAREVLPFTAVPVITPAGATSFDVFFDPAPLVEAGQQYAIIVQTPLVPPGGGQFTGVWGGSTTPGYLLGTPVTSNDNMVWTSASYDLFFRTYVAVPEPVVIVPFALAFTLLVRRR